MDTKKQVTPHRQIAPDHGKIGWYCDKVCIGGEALVAGGCVAWLFYDSWYALLLTPLFYPILGRLQEERKRQQRTQCMMGEFKEMLVILIGCMQAGDSVENAFRETERQWKALDVGPDLMRALHRMNQRMEINQSVEEAFGELAKEIDIEEAYQFEEILVFAKRMGGNYARHIWRTAQKLQEKICLYQEIETIVAEKRLEMKVMAVMPILMIAYVKLTSADLLLSLYHSPMGICLMSACLLVYLAMIYVGKRIITIVI